MKEKEEKKTNKYKRSTQEIFSIGLLVQNEKKQKELSNASWKKSAADKIRPDTNFPN